MQTPWFMHCHKSHNTLVGVYGTAFGTYVRSYVDGEIDVYFYPREPMRRVIQRVGLFGKEPDVENQIDAAVAKHLAELETNVAFRVAVDKWVGA